MRLPTVYDSMILWLENTYQQRKIHKLKGIQIPNLYNLIKWKIQERFFLKCHQATEVPSIET